MEDVSVKITQRCLLHGTDQMFAKTKQTLEDLVVSQMLDNKTLEVF